MRAVSLFGASLFSNIYVIGVRMGNGSLNVADITVRNAAAVRMLFCGCNTLLEQATRIWSIICD
jgi:hypothetical protein